MLHIPATETIGNRHGYPYIPVCSCGWSFPRGYASQDAALIMAEDHAYSA